MPSAVVQNSKGVKVTYVIRRSIFVIFMFFSVLVMFVCFLFLTVGLFYIRLNSIIEEGARISNLLNIAIMAEAGSTITQDAMSNAQNDLIIVQSFSKRILETYRDEAAKSVKDQSRLLDEREASKLREIGPQTATTEFSEGIEANDLSQGDGSLEAEAVVKVLEDSTDEGIFDPEQIDGSQADQVNSSQLLVEAETVESPIQGTEIQHDTAEETSETTEQNITENVELETKEDETIVADVSGESSEMPQGPTTLEESAIEQDQDSVEVGKGLKDRFFKYRNAIPMYQIEASNDYRVREAKVLFYARPYIESMEEIETVYSEEIRRDMRFCSDLALFMDQLLRFSSLDFPAIQSYVGTPSGSFCSSTTTTEFQGSRYKDTKREGFKCELDQSGYYNPLCRSWFKLQKKHQDMQTIADLYNDADTGQLLGSLCTSIIDPGTETFLGAICIDIDMIQGYFKTDNSNNLGPNIYDTPTILQFGNKLSLEHLGESILHTKVKNWEVQDSKIAKIYGKVEINEGSFEIPSETNERDYSEYKGYVGDAFTDYSTMQKVFFIFSSGGLERLNNFLSESPLQFCIFTRSQAIESVILMTDHIFTTVSFFWTPYFIFASIVYMLLCVVIIKMLTKSLTEPFLELSKRIHLNVRNIQKQKRKAEREKRDGQPHSKTSTIELQVDLLRGFKSRNKEMNELFMNFNSMAKILFVGHASAQTDFSYQQFFDLTAAAELLNNQRNFKGTGIIYMILAVKLALQSDENYPQAIRYMIHSEQIQEAIIRNFEAKAAGSELLKVRTKLIEDKYILAFRQYTRAIVSYNRFVEINNESYEKFSPSDPKRIEYRKQFDHIGFDALSYFQKSLDSWPSLNSKDGDSENSGPNEVSFDFFAHNEKNDEIQEKYVEDLEIGDNGSGVEGAEPQLLQGATLEPQPIKSQVIRQSQVLQFKRRLGKRLSLKQKNTLKSVIAQEKAKNGGEIKFISISSDESSFMTDSENSSDQNHSFLLGSEHHQVMTEHSHDSSRHFYAGGKEGEVPILEDNFEDYILYIRLKMTEIKILLLPGLQDLINQKNNLQRPQQDEGLSQQQESQSGSDSSLHSQTIRNISSNRSLMSSSSRLNETSELIGHMDQSSFFLSEPHFSQMSAPQHDFDQIIEANEESEESILSSVCLFKPRHTIVASEQLRLYFRTFKVTENVNPNFYFAIVMINKELDELGADILLYNSHKHSSVKPMGLSRIRKTFLEQTYYYLLGLHKFITKNEDDLSLKGAIKNLLESVKTGNQQVNAQAKKSFMLMNHIFHMIDAKQQTKLASVDTEIQLLKRQAARKRSKSLQRLQKPEKPKKKELITPCFPTLGRIMPGRKSMEFPAKEVPVAMKKQSGTSLPSIKRRVTIAVVKEYPVDIKLSQKICKRKALIKEVESLRRNITWTQQNLSRHVVTQRSIYFVLDSFFEHYKQHQMCMEFVQQTFLALDEDDYFGLSIRQERHLTLGSHEFILEEKKKNATVKRQMLEQLLVNENIGYNRQWNNYLKHDLAKALDQSALLPQKTVQYQGVEFKSPIKWVVALVGDIKGLTSLKDLPSEGGTNLMIVYVTDEQPEAENFLTIQQDIEENFPQGGLMIVRYREIVDSFFQKKDLLKNALSQLKSAISLYPSRNIPIIQEQFHL